MILERNSQPINGVKCRRRDVIERAPVVRNEVSGLQPLEQCEGIVAGQMSFPESRLPPWRMPYRQQRQIEVSSLVEELLFHHVCRIALQSRVASEKARDFISIE